MIKSWSPSKLDKYEQCPLACKLQTEDKLCPVCFKGRTSGGFGKPIVCDTCKQTIPEPEAFTRGTRINNDLDDYVTGKTTQVPLEGAKVMKWLGAFREAHEQGKLKIQLQIAFDRNWNLVAWFAREAWLRVSLDVLHLRTKTLWDVIDWKTGKLRTDGKYGDQLAIYNTAVLTAYPAVKAAMASLIFVDAGVAIPGETLRRAGLRKEQTRWEQRTKRMLADETFKPTPGFFCRWCDYAKAKGGPCAY